MNAWPLALLALPLFGSHAYARAPRVALVMSDSRDPWPPNSPHLNEALWWATEMETAKRCDAGGCGNVATARANGSNVFAMDLYYTLAVALAANYARLHCYDLRIYRTVARRGKHVPACRHPSLGGRGISWCKLVAVHHTLWARAEAPAKSSTAAAAASATASHAAPATASGATTVAAAAAAAGASSESWAYDLVVYLDSDAFFHDPTRSVPRLLRDYSGPGAEASQLPYTQPPYAWFASNWPYHLQPGRRFSLGSPGQAHANAAFFILRNGADAKRLVSQWWSAIGAAKYAFLPWFEQVCMQAA